MSGNDPANAPSLATGFRHYERRHGGRRGVLAECNTVVADAAAARPALLLNVSAHGVAVHTSRPLTPGAQVGLEFQLSDTDQPISATCEVMWADRQGRAGLTFAAMSEHARQDLQAWLTAPDNALIDPGTLAPRLDSALPLPVVPSAPPSNRAGNDVGLEDAVSDEAIEGWLQSLDMASLVSEGVEPSALPDLAPVADATPSPSIAELLAAACPPPAPEEVVVQPPPAPKPRPRVENSAALKPTVGARAIAPTPQPQVEVLAAAPPTAGARATAPPIRKQATSSPPLPPARPASHQPHETPTERPRANANIPTVATAKVAAWGAADVYPPVAQFPLSPFVNQPPPAGQKRYRLYLTIATVVLVAAIAAAVRPVASLWNNTGTPQIRTAPPLPPTPVTSRPPAAVAPAKSAPVLSAVVTETRPQANQSPGVPPPRLVVRPDQRRVEKPEEDETVPGLTAIDVTPKQLGLPNPGLAAPRRAESSPAPPQAAPTPRISSTVMNARLVRETKPQYPEFAKQTGAEGVVTLDVRIGADGTVKTVRVISGPSAFLQAAVAAVKTWRYRPYTSSTGVPVEVFTEVTVRFSRSR